MSMSNENYCRIITRDEPFETSDKKEAEDAMRAKMRESNRTEKQGTLTLAPLPGIVAGGKVILKGFPDEVDDQYLVDRAVHRFHSKSGYKIRVDLVRDVEDQPVEVNFVE